MIHQILFWLISSRLSLSERTQVDYWDDNFDENKNCASEDEIPGLMNAGRCAVRTRGETAAQGGAGDSSGAGSDEVRWEECKRELTDKLQNTCAPMGVRKVSCPYSALSDQISL